jgi:hypothetical protein
MTTSIIPISKYAADQYEDPSWYGERGDDDDKQEDLAALELLQKDYEELADQAPLERIKWLDDDKRDAPGPLSEGWIEEEIERVSEELVGDSTKDIMLELGEDARYYDQVTIVQEYAQNMVWDLIHEAKKMSKEEALKETIDSMRKDYGKEVERMKKEDAEEQREYEETRDIVRHMQEPGEPKVEITTDPGKLENLPGPELGSVAFERGGKMLAKLYKLAYKLDKMALYDEAKEIEKVMKTLSERVGLTAEDMVSLADHFDQSGDIALADKFDEMVKQATKKKKKKVNTKLTKAKKRSHQ